MLRYTYIACLVRKYFDKKGIDDGFRNVLTCYHNSGNMFALCFHINCLQSVLITVVFLLIL